MSFRRFRFWAMGADGFAVMRCVAVTGERMIFAVLRTSAPQDGERPMELFNREYWSERLLPFPFNYYPLTVVLITVVLYFPIH